MMRLTSFTDFGLRALMRLAGHPGRLFAADPVAQTFGISRNHRTKVIRELAAGGVTTRRGAGGGFRLARSADDVTPSEIVRLQETRSALIECFRADGSVCTLAPGYRLRGKLDAVPGAFLRELNRTTLAECAYPVRGRMPLAAWEKAGGRPCRAF